MLPLLSGRVLDQMADGARQTSGIRQEEQREALIDGGITYEEQYSLGTNLDNHGADCRISRSLSTRTLVYSTSPGGTAIAAATVEQPAEPTRPAFWSCDPGSRLPGRVVPYVLLMPAFKDRHPVTFLILLETRNPPVHALSDPTGLPATV